ncbi:dihydroxyacetone kinase subunit DhaL [Alkalihalobacillus sp. BA299]|uniref:dihydroxyacetone kinase subunit DhaL n=1 Tax=Alkalihalobacillus sp. BA299 TaxID=2815938 RepID=UPI001ADB746A|nr:dihydroxyacetone kinase subunit DhaL [Alkalihalobacillus sp. BA299]
MINATEWKEILLNIAEKIEEEKDYLSELDRKTGDGDHGVTMSIGWQAIREKIQSDLQDVSDCGLIAKEVGKTFLNAVGSSVGPLYATGFLRGSKIFEGKEQLDGSDFIQFWITFGDGIQDRGKAEVGDKTMVDTFAPLVETLKQHEQGDFLQVFNSALEKAKQGMESTKDLVSKKGRSSRLGERSKGSLDPGATSAYFILETFYGSILKLHK